MTPYDPHRIAQERADREAAGAGGLFARPVRPFDGETYDHEHDHDRLSTLFDRVLAVASSGPYFTLAELRERCGGSEGGIGARLRDAKKLRFGGHTLQRQHRGDPKDGIYEYRLILRRPNEGQAA